MDVEIIYFVCNILLSRHNSISYRKHLHLKNYFSLIFVYSILAGNAFAYTNWDTRLITVKEDQYTIFGEGLQSGILTPNITENSYLFGYIKDPVSGQFGE